MKLFALRDYVEKTDEFINYVHQMKWNYGIPGGFLNNFPNRYVNAFGTGAEIDNQGKIIKAGWTETSWTAKINQNNVTLKTKTEELPEPFLNIIPGLRRMFMQVYPYLSLTTFNIAVCNYYTNPEMYIAAHTDDNEWYPDETGYGPVFASLTLYPFNKPSINEEYGRFQVYLNDQWIDIQLPDESVLIMQSSIKHRVLKHTKKNQQYFLPRINITFRSTYSMNINPLMNAMAVANHARYYRIPYKLVFPTDLSYDKMLTIYQAYQHFGIIVEYNDENKKDYKDLYDSIVSTFSLMPIKYTTNMTTDLIKMVVERIKQQY